MLISEMRKSCAAYPLRVCRAAPFWAVDGGSSIGPGRTKDDRGGGSAGCAALSMTAVELTFWLFRVGARFDVGFEALCDEMTPDSVDELSRFLVDLASDIYGDAKFRACGIG